VRSIGITYVLAHLARLVEGGAMHVAEWPGDRKGISMMASITREGVAKWLTDAALEYKWNNTCPVIST
jgi:hypothetical protein